MELGLKILIGLAIASWILTPIAIWLTYKMGYLRGQIYERKLLIKEMEDGLDSCDIALEHLRRSAPKENPLILKPLHIEGDPDWFKPGDEFEITF